MTESRPPSTGDVLAGKYRVEQVLGEGGMGVVVAATHLELDQKVALKFMHENVVQIGLERFLREAKAVAKLKSEFVARVMDVGKLEGGAPYIVMEYLEGEDLADLIERGPLPVDSAVDYVLQAAVALAEAHSRNIVHRDIKLRNLFLTRRPDGAPLVKVLDFGISKMTASDADGSSTQTGATIGSPSYMSPEQVRSSKDVDARTDIWSLGTVLYQLVTGRLPFVAQTVPDMFVAILHGEVTPASSVAPGVPPALDAVIAKCLAKDRDERFASMAELAVALEPFASPDGRPLVRSAVNLLGGMEATRLTPAPMAPGSAVAMASSAEVGPTTPGLSVSQAPAAASRRPLVWGALGAVALVGIGVVVAVRSIAGSGPSTAASAPAATESVAPELPPSAAVSAAPSASAAPSVSVLPSASVAPSASAAPAPRPAARPVARPAPNVKPPPPTKPTVKPKPPEDDPFGTVQ